MKISDQVCTLEQAKKLYELGVKQESQYYWVSFGVESGQSFALCRPASNYEERQGVCWFIVDDADHELQNEINEGSCSADGPVYSAFTLEEIGSQLPSHIEKSPIGPLHLLIQKNAEWWLVMYINPGETAKYCQVSNKSLTQAMIGMLLKYSTDNKLQNESKAG